MPVDFSAFSDVPTDPLLAIELGRVKEQAVAAQRKLHQLIRHCPVHLQDAMMRQLDVLTEVPMGLALAQARSIAANVDEDRIPEEHRGSFRAFKEWVRELEEKQAQPDG